MRKDIWTFNTRLMSRTIVSGSVFPNCLNQFIWIRSFIFDEHHKQDVNIIFGLYKSNVLTGRMHTLEYVEPSSGGCM